MSEPGTRSVAELLREIDAERRKRDEDNRRLGVVVLDQQLLHQLLGAPDDVDVVQVWAEPATRSINVLVRCARFRPVHPGCHAPEVANKFLLMANTTDAAKPGETVTLHIDKDADPPGEIKTYVRFEWAEPE